MLLCITALAGGGAERVISTLANQLSERGVRVAVVTFLEPTEQDYALNEHVERFAIGVGGGRGGIVGALWRNAQRIGRLRSLLRAWRPDVTVAFMESPSIAAIIASRLSGRPVVVSERLDPRTYVLPQPWRALRRLTYPKADLVVLQTAGVADGWGRSFLDASRICVLPNPIGVEIATAPLPGNERENVILAAGRLSTQKGFDVLLRAWAEFRTRNPLLELQIAGEGPERASLERIISELDLESSVRLLGRVGDLPSRMRRARAFVLSSRSEGFPNVLLEALAAGTPVVSTDCPSGPREILESSIAGLLTPVEDSQALAAGIEAVLDEGLFERRCHAALDVASRYAGPLVAEEWLRTLERVIARARDGAPKA